MLLGAFSDEQPWDKPFNDTCINTSRDELPVHTRIYDLIERTTAILREGGRKMEIDSKPACRLPVP